MFQIASLDIHLFEHLGLYETWLSCNIIFTGIEDYVCIKLYLFLLNFYIEVENTNGRLNIYQCVPKLIYTFFSAHLSVKRSSFENLRLLCYLLYLASTCLLLYYLWDFIYSRLSDKRGYIFEILKFNIICDTFCVQKVACFYCYWTDAAAMGLAPS